MAQVSLIVGARNLIEELRCRQGVTRTELARRLNVSTPYVTQALRGDTNMTLNTVELFVGALGASVEITTRAAEDESWQKQRQSPAQKPKRAKATGQRRKRTTR